MKMRGECALRKEFENRNEKTAVEAAQMVQLDTSMKTSGIKADSLFDRMVSIASDPTTSCN